MDLTDLQGTITIVSAVAIIVGVFGVVVPMVPGLALTWAGVLVWAIFGGASGWRWLVLGIATVIWLFGSVIKYLLPGKQLKDSGVPNRSIVIGGLLGIVGFFVIPVVGLVLGFVLGIWLSEQARLKNGSAAWQSTKHALKATGLALLIELTAAMGIVLAWVLGLIFA
jgi:uncharacterized protein YqgC (DUF456 family)